MTLFEQVFCTRVGFTAILILRLSLCFLCCPCLEHKHFRGRAGGWLTFTLFFSFQGTECLFAWSASGTPAAVMFLLGLPLRAYVTISRFKLLSGTLETRHRNERFFPVCHMTAVRRGSQLLLGREKTNNQWRLCGVKGLTLSVFWERLLGSHYSSRWVIYILYHFVVYCVGAFFVQKGKTGNLSFLCWSKIMNYV